MRVEISSIFIRLPSRPTRERCIICHPSRNTNSFLPITIKQLTSFSTCRYLQLRAEIAVSHLGGATSRIFLRHLFCELNHSDAEDTSGENETWPAQSSNRVGARLNVEHWTEIASVLDRRLLCARARKRSCLPSASCSLMPKTCGTVSVPCQLRDQTWSCRHHIQGQNSSFI